MLMLDTQTGKMAVAETGPWVSSGSRGGFDRLGNAWYGGRGGMLMRMNIETKKLTEFPSPIQYDTFYEAMPDKNGEVWAGGLEPPVPALQSENRKVYAIYVARAVRARSPDGGSQFHQPGHRVVRGS